MRLPSVSMASSSVLHPLHRAEREPLGERSIAFLEPGRRGAEDAVRVGVVLEDAEEDLVRRRPRRTYVRSPRSHAS